MPSPTCLSAPYLLPLRSASLLPLPNPPLASSKIPIRSRNVTCARTPRTQQALNKASEAASSSNAILSGADLEMVLRAAEVAGRSAGLTMPHPNHGCVVTDVDGNVVAEAFLYAQGTESCEVQAVRVAGRKAGGGCAYLNMECGDCHGDNAAVAALVCAGLARVVVGMLHPAPHHRRQAVRAMKEASLEVLVLGDCAASCRAEDVQAAIMKCMEVNEALVHRITMRRPLSILKYAMTLDGKIATSTGHSTWVSGEQSRSTVHQLRSLCDAVVVGGQTVRKDNCRLTTRRKTGHRPTRVVITRAMDLPRDANLWNISEGPTIVCTQKGANLELQNILRGKGVEVAEFESLSPGAVADFCYARGFLQLLWECGGGLAAPAIADAVIHKLQVYIAPKVIGGQDAPTPIKDLGLQDMTQALELVEVRTQVVGQDMLVVGYLKDASGGLARQTELLDALAAAPSESGGTSSEQVSKLLPIKQRGGFWRMRDKPPGTDAEFYKVWDRFGCLSNFSAHPIRVKTPGANAQEDECREWPTVEHYYQAQKFGGEAAPSAAAKEVVEAIACARSPEEAAFIGRRAEREQPWLLVKDWQSAKVEAMRRALFAKFSTHDQPRRMLLSTAGREVVEATPHDSFWGCGCEGRGRNRLGRLLMELRDWLLGTSPPPEGIVCSAEDAPEPKR